ncbi:hypothetical protein ABW19_dt0209820 [Dactylella cylindrospora]|nr:hypothetical protein ABW19_dt0209820 [Dactylella cylindrospora]
MSSNGQNFAARDQSKQWEFEDFLNLRSVSSNFDWSPVEDFDNPEYLLEQLGRHDVPDPNKGPSGDLGISPPSTDTTPELMITGEEDPSSSSSSQGSSPQPQQQQETYVTATQPHISNVVAPLPFDLEAFSHHNWESIVETIMKGCTDPQLPQVEPTAESATAGFGLNPSSQINPQVQRSPPRKTRKNRNTLGNSRYLVTSEAAAQLVPQGADVYRVPDRRLNEEEYTQLLARMTSIEHKKGRISTIDLRFPEYFRLYSCLEEFNKMFNWEYTHETVLVFNGCYYIRRTCGTWFRLNHNLDHYSDLVKGDDAMIAKLNGKKIDGNWREIRRHCDKMGNVQKIEFVTPRI